MDRRSIIRSVLTAVAFENHTQPAKAQIRKEVVFVPNGEDRFHEETMLPHCKLSAKDTNGALCIFGGDHSNPLRAGNPQRIASARKMIRRGVPLHVHHHQDEFWYIVDGEYSLQIGDRKMRAKAGDSVFAPRGIPHSPRLISEQGSLLSVLQPAGSIEDFFREWAKLLKKAGAMPTSEQMAEVFRTHGMEIVGPAVEP
jgi:mannose-6-phosphate isomerase-like protein (cupin superfamily)